MSDPTPLRRALDAVTADLRAGTAGGVVDLVRAWSEIVGPMLDAVTEPGSMRDGVLTVHAADPGAASAVRQRAGEIGERLATVLGPGQVRQLRVVVRRGG